MYGNRRNQRRRPHGHRDNAPRPMAFHHTLPKDTQRIRSLIISAEEEKHTVTFYLPHGLDNFYLLLNKYGLPLLDKGLKETKLKLDFFKEVAKKSSSFFEKTKDLSASRLLIRKIETSDKEDYKNFNLTLEGRMVVGLGSSSVYETGITLDFITGIPYIPGSALKGITRNAFIIKWAEDLGDDSIDLECLDALILNFDEKEWEKDKEKGKGAEYIRSKSKIKRDKNDIFLSETISNKINADTKMLKTAQKLFGTQKSEGCIIFLDAYPARDMTLEADIMNSHYQNYYSGSASPTDSQKPNPIPFLTVKKTTFNFTLLLNKSIKGSGRCEGADLLDEAIKYLKIALTEYTGAGAKTALGYGYFRREREND